MRTAMLHINMDWIRLTVVFIYILRQGDAYPDGAPSSTCLTMFPKHGIDATWTDSGPCPYQIQLSQDNYNPNQIITITLGSNQGKEIKGIQICAHRKHVNRDELVGTFIEARPTNKLKIMSCAGGTDNQVTHSNDDHVSVATLRWRAPSENVGDIVFMCTFVEDYDRFWAMQTKDLNAANATRVVIPRVKLEVPNTNMADIDLTTCGQSKGCVLYPSGCGGVDCDAALTFTPSSNMAYFNFEMMAKSSGYVSAGFTFDTRMGDDQTITCTARDGSVTVQNGMNPAYFNHRTLSYNLTNLSVKRTDTHVMCRFRRPVRMDVYIGYTHVDEDGKESGSPKNLVFDLSKSNLYVALAWGSLAIETDVMSMHVLLPVVTNTPVDFTQVAVYGGYVLSREHKAHGSLMTIAWILLTGMATIIARYYRTLGGDRKLFGIKIWFQVHRGLAVAVLVLTLIAFIIIFVKKGEFAKEAGLAHAVVGIIVFAAVILQVIFGVLRPGLDSKLRSIFTWGHRVSGKLTHILAAVNILLAFNISYMHPSTSKYGTTVVCLWIVLQVLWEIAFEVWAHRKQIPVQDEVKESGFKIMEVSQKSDKVDMIMLISYLTFLIVFAICTLCGIII